MLYKYITIFAVNDVQKKVNIFSLVVDIIPFSSFPLTLYLLNRPSVTPILESDLIS